MDQSTRYGLLTANGLDQRFTVWCSSLIIGLMDIISSTKVCHTLQLSFSHKCTISGLETMQLDLFLNVHTLPYRAASPHSTNLASYAPRFCNGIQLSLPSYEGQTGERRASWRTQNSCRVNLCQCWRIVVKDLLNVLLSNERNQEKVIHGLSFLEACKQV